jgi:hypothetical protein
MFRNGSLDSALCESGFSKDIHDPGFRELLQKVDAER